MTDEEVRAIIMAGVNVEYSITMRERTRLHILPDQVKQQFHKALNRYMAGEILEKPLTEKKEEQKANIENKPYGGYIRIDDIEK